MIHPPDLDFRNPAHKQLALIHIFISSKTFFLAQQFQNNSSNSYKNHWHYFHIKANCDAHPYAIEAKELKKKNFKLIPVDYKKNHFMLGFIK